MFRNRHRDSILASAFLPVLASMSYTEGGEGGGAGGKEKKDEKKDPPKLELTQADLDAQKQAAVEAALQKERNDAATQKKKDEAAAAEKKAKEDGDLQALKDAADEKRITAESERDEANMKARTLEVKDKLRDHLAEKHPEYVAVAKYIMPLITFDLKTDDNDIDKSITTATDQYVKDNPRKTTNPPPPGRNQPVPARTDARVSPNRNNGVARSRF